MPSGVKDKQSTGVDFASSYARNIPGKVATEPAAGRSMPAFQGGVVTPEIRAAQYNQLHKRLQNNHTLPEKSAKGGILKSISRGFKKIVATSEKSPATSKSHDKGGFKPWTSTKDYMMYFDEKWYGDLPEGYTKPPFHW